MSYSGSMTTENDVNTPTSTPISDDLQDIILDLSLMLYEHVEPERLNEEEMELFNQACDLVTGSM